MLLSPYKRIQLFLEGVICAPLFYAFIIFVALGSFVWTKKKNDRTLLVHPVFFLTCLVLPLLRVQFRGIKNLRKHSIVASGHYTTIETMITPNLKKEDYVISKKWFIADFLMLFAEKILLVSKGGRKITKKQAQMMAVAFKKIHKRECTMTLFPQGTRCDVREKNPPIYSTIYDICRRTNTPCCPANSSTGVLFRRSGLPRMNISPLCFAFYDLISPNLGKEQFMKTLIKVIEKSRCQMLKEFD